jgi:putative nucleotidyltransferase with HDIG domain
MITQKIFETYKFWFNDYVNRFIKEYPELSENIEIKADHCWQVRKEISGITQNLKLNEQESLLAEIIGLFHDVGRFKQYVKYQTFSDSKSQNHAELGVEVLKENNILKDLSDENKEIVYKSILNHSRAEIIPDENEKVEFFSRLIRDADKLDIWRLITEYYMVKEQKANKTLELELPDKEEISDQVYEAILNNKVVLKESMKTLNDFKLLQIAWLFDLNYNYSIKRLFDKKYLDKIFDTLPKNRKVNEIKGIVNKYFKNHIETLIYN